MLKLPDRHDAAVLAGMSLLVFGVFQVLPWLAIIVAGGCLIYIGVFTERS